MPGLAFGLLSLSAVLASPTPTPGASLTSAADVRGVIRRGTETVFADEPMRSSLVLGRAAAVRELLTRS